MDFFLSTSCGLFEKGIGVCSRRFQIESLCQESCSIKYLKDNLYSLKIAFGVHASLMVKMNEMFRYFSNLNLYTLGSPCQILKL